MSEQHVCDYDCERVERVCGNAFDALAAELAATRKALRDAETLFRSVIDTLSDPDGPEAVLERCIRDWLANDAALAAGTEGAGETVPADTPEGAIDRLTAEILRAERRGEEITAENLRIARQALRAAVSPDARLDALLADIEPLARDALVAELGYVPNGRRVSPDAPKWSAESEAWWDTYFRERGWLNPDDPDFPDARLIEALEYAEGVLSRDPFDEAQRQYAAKILRAALDAVRGGAS